MLAGTEGLIVRGTAQIVRCRWPELRAHGIPRSIVTQSVASGKRFDRTHGKLADRKWLAVIDALMKDLGTRRIRFV